MGKSIQSVICAILVPFCISLAACSNMPETQEATESKESDSSVSSFSINESGQTFGTMDDVHIPSDFQGTISESKVFYPDLIAVATSDGIEGYVYLDDYLVEDTLEQAISGKYRRSLAGVVVYASDGKTILGTA